MSYSNIHFLYKFQVGPIQCQSNLLKNMIYIYFLANFLYSIYYRDTRASLVVEWFFLTVGSQTLWHIFKLQIIKTAHIEKNDQVTAWKKLSTLCRPTLRQCICQFTKWQIHVGYTLSYPRRCSMLTKNVLMYRARFLLVCLRIFPLQCGDGL